MRPVAKESETWLDFDVEVVADEVVEPDVGDANTVVAQPVEQVLIMGPPALEGYSSVARLEIKVLAGSAFGNADLIVRARIGAQWLDPLTIALDETLSWHTASYELDTSRGELNDLAVGMAKDGAALVLIDVLYVTVQGPAAFVQPSDDLTLFDGTEVVRLVRADGDESLIAHALRSADIREEASGSAGTYGSSQKKCHTDIDLK
jgi:hypothetical protein